jgi:hypothetical protein
MNYYKEHAKLERFIVKETRIPSKHTSREYWLEGDPNFVMLEVAKRLKADSTTEMYDHMRLQVMDVKYDVFPGGIPNLRVRMYQNFYAGD